MQIDENLIQNAPAMLSKLRAEAARRSFKEFIHRAWPTIEPGTPLVWGWSMDAIVDHLEAVSRGDIAAPTSGLVPWVALILWTGTGTCKHLSTWMALRVARYPQWTRHYCQGGEHNTPSK